MTATRTPSATGPGAAWASDVADTLAALAASISCPLSGVSGTNTITATASLPVTANAIGQCFSFMPANANTGAVTIDVGGGAKALKDRAGNALASGRLVPGVVEKFIDVGAEFRLLTEAPQSAVTLKRAVFVLQRTAGTDGGSVTGGARTRYPFNTTIVNDIPGLSLDTTTNVGRFTVPAGTFTRIEAECSFFGVSRVSIHLRNITAGSDITAGIARRAGNSADNARLFGQLTLGGSTQVEVQYSANDGETGNGLGVAVNDPGGAPEQFGTIEFQTT